MEKEKTLYLLEKEQVFSRSMLWKIQERYFSERGVDAWRQGEVPYYVTSNPTIANSYAEIVFAFYRDRQQLHPHTNAEPFYICELGAGSGRFAFHFLKRLQRLCEQHDISPMSFCYVLTDVAESNLQFWEKHKSFETFFENGMLDVAQFDLNLSEQLLLRCSGKTITNESLFHPLIVIGNYVFDSIPQELYYIDKKQCYDCLISIASDQEPQPESAAALMNSLHYKYDYNAFSNQPFEEKFLQELLEEYKENLSDTHLFFPANALQSLERLKNFSKAGMLLLSADKGDHRLDNLERAHAPVLVHHGSFSINVNYHAFKLFCEQENGMALFPDRSYSSVNMGCLLFVKEANAHKETHRAYQRQVIDFGPDDFFKLSKHVAQHAETMSVEDILSYLRLAFFDSQVLMLCTPRLAALVGEMKRKERESVKQALDQVWETYFPLGESADVAWHLAGLFYEMDDFHKAIYYFEKSLEIYGPYSGTLCNLSVCCELAGQQEKAKSYLLQVLKTEPENERAKKMLNKEVE